MLIDRKEKTFGVEVRALVDDILQDVIEGVSSADSYDPLTLIMFSPFILKMKDKIMDNKHYKKCEKFLLSNEWIKANHGRMIQLDERRIILAPFELIAVLIECVIRRSNIAFRIKMSEKQYHTPSNKAITEVVESLIKFITTPYIEYSTEGILTGVDCRIVEGRIGDFTIRRSDPGDGSKFADGKERAIAIVSRSDRLERDSLFDSTTEPHIQYPWWTDSPEDAFVDLLALLKMSYTGFNFRVAFPDAKASFFGSFELMFGESTHDKTTRRGRYIASSKVLEVIKHIELDDTGLKKLQETWDEIQGLGKEGDVILNAMRRTALSTLRERSEDAIIDLIVALEGLLVNDGIDTSNLSYKTRMRTSALLSGSGISDVFETITKAYSKRSAILHASKITEKNANEPLRKKLESITLIGLKRYINIAKQLAPGCKVPNYLDSLMIKGVTFEGVN